MVRFSVLDKISYMWMCFKDQNLLFLEKLSSVCTSHYLTINVYYYSRNSHVFSKCLCYENGTASQLPLVEDEMKKATGEKSAEESEQGGSGSKLVTSDGTYATQSVFNTIS